MRDRPIRLAVATALVTCIAGRAEAQPEQTLLHLSASASVQVIPGELVADLAARSSSSDPATAQRHVNVMMAAGLAASREVAGVVAHSTGYAVQPGDDKRATWNAEQTLELRDADGPALLDLIGRLQGRGLTVAALGWQVSPAMRDKAHQEAVTAALHDLQAQAQSAAHTLGLQVDHIQDVRLDGPDDRPRPPYGALAMAVRSATPMPAPEMIAAPEDVTAGVSATIVLRR